MDRAREWQARWFGFEPVRPGFVHVCSPGLEPVGPGLEAVRHTSIGVTASHASLEIWHRSCSGVELAVPPESTSVVIDVLSIVLSRLLMIASFLTSSERRSCTSSCSCLSSITGSATLRCTATERDTNARDWNPNPAAPETTTPTNTAKVDLIISLVGDEDLASLGSGAVIRGATRHFLPRVGWWTWQRGSRGEQELPSARDELDERSPTTRCWLSLWALPPASRPRLPRSPLCALLRRGPPR